MLGNITAPLPSPAPFTSCDKVQATTCTHAVSTVTKQLPCPPFPFFPLPPSFGAGCSQRLPCASLPPPSPPPPSPLWCRVHATCTLMAAVSLPSSPLPSWCSHITGCMQPAVQRPCTGEQDPQVRHPRAPGCQGVDGVESTLGTRRYRGTVRLQLLQNAGAIVIAAECRHSEYIVSFSPQVLLE